MMGNINQDNTCNYVRKTITFTLKLFAISGGEMRKSSILFLHQHINFFKVKEVALFIMIFLRKSKFVNQKILNRPNVSRSMLLDFRIHSYHKSMKKATMTKRNCFVFEGCCQSYGELGIRSFT